jgi:hypothetical protein
MTEVEQLHAEMAATEQKISAARDDSCNHREKFLLDELAREQRLLKNQADQLALTIQRGEATLTRAMLAAEQLVVQSHLGASVDVRL